MNFELCQIGDITYYTLPLWQKDGAFVALSERCGGVSKAPWDSLNLALHVDDTDEAVLANRRRFFGSLGIDWQAPVFMQQVHGDNIQIVTDKERGRGAVAYVESLPETDGLITAVRHLPLVAFAADCVPVILFDPRQQVIAVCHAGWKGTVLKIGAKALNLMQNNFDSRPEDCLAAIGTSIGPCHFKVNGQVLERFRQAGFNMNELISDYHCDENEQETAFLDLWRANSQTLLQKGVLRENISVARICTYCEQQRWFSYRAAGGVTGRLATVVMLK